MNRFLGYENINGHGEGLGNQLFFFASSFGLAKLSNKLLMLPTWNYQQYFNWPNFSFFTIRRPNKHEGERCFHFDNTLLERIKDKSNVMINGYLQSEKYFENYSNELKDILTFKEDLSIDYPCIGIHIRRGDYINNPMYHNLPIEYYKEAIKTFFPNWKDKIKIFSDDIEWCKHHFLGENIEFSENKSNIEDLNSLSRCTHFILSNSTYSWWGAWLGEKKDTVIVRPTQYFEDKMKNNDTKDFWPNRWKEFDYTKKT